MTGVDWPSFALGVLVGVLILATFLGAWGAWEARAWRQLRLHRPADAGGARVVLRRRPYDQDGST
jgi:hypothetical protein